MCAGSANAGWIGAAVSVSAGCVSAAVSANAEMSGNAGCVRAVSANAVVLL